MCEEYTERRIDALGPHVFIEVVNVYSADLGLRRGVLFVHHSPFSIVSKYNMVNPLKASKLMDHCNTYSCRNFDTIMQIVKLNDWFKIFTRDQPGNLVQLS